MRDAGGGGATRVLVPLNGTVPPPTAPLGVCASCTVSPPSLPPRLTPAQLQRRRVHVRSGLGRTHVERPRCGHGAGTATRWERGAGCALGSELARRACHPYATLSRPRVAHTPASIRRRLLSTSEPSRLDVLLGDAVLICGHRALLLPPPLPTSFMPPPRPPPPPGDRGGALALPAKFLRCMRCAHGRCHRHGLV